MIVKITAKEVHPKDLENMKEVSLDKADGNSFAMWRDSGVELKRLRAEADLAFTLADDYATTIKTDMLEAGYRKVSADGVTINWTGGERAGGFDEEKLAAFLLKHRKSIDDFRKPKTPFTSLRVTVKAS